MSWGLTRRGCIATFACVAGLVWVPAPASADHHLMLIREVAPNNALGSGFVELQMYEANQNLVATHHVVVYGPTGAETHRYTFPDNVPNGESQRTVLLGDVGVPGRDFTDENLDISAVGGAVCFVSSYLDVTPDCVTWGNFAGTLDIPTGSPASPGGITTGKSLVRRIDRGCSTRLDMPFDTTFDSAADFTEQTPSPRSNGVTPTESPCPETRIATTPANPNNGTAATFTFDSPGNTNPVPPGLSFTCKLDNEPDFSACSSPKSYVSPPLDEGSHTFSVKAALNGVEDPSPATYTWVIDRSPPDTTITPGTTPADPTASQTANFGFTSTEANSTFTCKLDAGNPEGCNSGTKQYTNLAHGPHTFTVFATDRAGNKDDTAPATYTWMVDRSPPDTTIDSGPQQPVSTVDTADFTYHSEAGATFRCKLDAQAETDCNEPGGISYADLGEGQHTFRVYSIDALGNSETLANAATYTWTVDAVVDPPDPPETTIIKAPKRKGTDKTPTISFKATPAPATFQCRVDAGAYAPCTSPHTTKKLKPGRHTFDVFATGEGGVDPTPARSSFKIVTKR